MKKIFMTGITVLTAATSFFFPMSIVSAMNFATVFPVSDLPPQWGISAWDTSQGSEHFSLVDEPASCDDATYVYTRIDISVEDFGYDLSSIPNGSVITAIDLYPCAGTWAGGRSATSTLNFAPVINGEQLPGFDGTGYIGQIPFQSGSNKLHEYGPRSWSVNVEKNAQTTLSAVYFYTGSHPKPQTIVLSRARIVITYIP